MTNKDIISNLTNGTLLIEAGNVYVRRYLPNCGEYLPLSEFDKLILDEFRARNGIAYEDTVYVNGDALAKYRDCIFFLRIESTLELLLCDLKTVNHSCKWFPKLKELTEEIVTSLSTWTFKAKWLRQDCLNIAKELEDQL